MLLSWFLSWTLPSAYAGDVRVDVVDVGQGDAILIRTPAGKTILIDAGDNGADTVPKLKSLGVDHLDLVVATHPHADHIGDMDEVLAAFPVKLYTDNGLPHTTQTYASVMQAIEDKGIAYRAAEVGQSYSLDDGAKLDILFPNGTKLSDTRSDLNANSVVTRLTHGKDCFLFTGDSEEPTERALLNQGLGACEVLKVAHHGSNHSTTTSFLNTVQPRIALISVGAGNRYDHPGPETLGRLASAGAEIHRTDLEGTLTVVSTGNGVRVSGNKGAVAEVAPPPTPAPSHAASAPPPGPTPAKAPANPPAACPFYASSASDVFHETSCGNVARIKPENLTCYTSREAALAAGKRPAGCCDP